MNTTEGASQIGAQRAMPSSVERIQAQVKQARRALDRAGEQGEDGQVGAKINNSVETELRL